MDQRKSLYGSSVAFIVSADVMGNKRMFPPTPEMETWRASNILSLHSMIYRAVVLCMMSLNTL
jgi:hypothetical protein